MTGVAVELVTLLACAVAAVLGSGFTTGNRVVDLNKHLPVWQLWC